MDSLLCNKVAQNHYTNVKESHDKSGPPTNIPKSKSIGNDVSNHLPANDIEGVSGISNKHGDNSFAARKEIKTKGSELYMEELPRANIVSATRTLFESSTHKDDPPKGNISREVMFQNSSDHYSCNTLDNGYMCINTTTNRVERDALANRMDDSTCHYTGSRADIGASDLSNRASSAEVSHEQSQDTLQGVHSTGKVCYFSGTEPQDTSPRGYECNQVDKNDCHVDSGHSAESRSPRSAVKADNQFGRLSFQHGSQVQSSSLQHTDEPSSIIDQKNQRNADLSLPFERSTHDSIYTSSESSTSRLLPWSTKRPAPEPPNEISTRKHAGFMLDSSTESTVLKGTDSSVKKSDGTKPFLHRSGPQSGAEGEDLYLTNHKEITESSPSYRDLYFTHKKDGKSGSSSSTKLDFSGTKESVVDDDDKHLLKKPPTSDNANNTIHCV